MEANIHSPATATFRLAMPASNALVARDKARRFFGVVFAFLDFKSPSLAEEAHKEAPSIERVATVLKSHSLSTRGFLLRLTPRNPLGGGGYYCNYESFHCRHCEQLDSAFLQNLMRGNLLFLYYRIDCHARVARSQ